MTREYHLQVAVNEYLEYMSGIYNFRHFHVPNEGKRSIGYNLKLKRMGLKSGCPDIIIEYPEGKVLYIELKTNQGKLSNSQKLWAVQSKALGTPHFVVKGEISECIIEVRRLLEKYIPKR